MPLSASLPKYININEVRYRVEGGEKQQQKKTKEKQLSNQVNQELVTH